MFLKDFVQVSDTFFMWDAVVAWRDNIFLVYNWSTTKSNYVLNMLRLIEAGIVNVRMELNKADEVWLKECKKKINELTEWAPETKSVRKSTLNSLYKFIQSGFNRGTIPYQWHPSPAQIKHVLSGVQDKVLTTTISPEVLCNTLSETNERDAYIVWLMMHTGQRLEAILDLKKTALRQPYIDIEGISYYTPSHIIKGIKNICGNSKVYLFETCSKTRVVKTQVIRNLKKTGYKIGLTYNLTPKLLHGYAVAYITGEKRNELQTTLMPQIIL